MKPASHRQKLLLNAEKDYRSQLPFFMQPIMGAGNGLVFGFEILYRGGVPRNWSLIDESVLRHLCETPADTLPTFFVNISSQAFLDTPAERFIEAARRHRIYFEMSEAQADRATLQRIAARMRELSGRGVLFARDDYGSDPDSLERVFSLDCISMIKVDSVLLNCAMQNRGAADMLYSLLAHWRQAQIASIAERVETPAMLEFAQQAGFDFVQGFHVDALLSGLEGGEEKKGAGREGVA